MSAAREPSPTSSATQERLERLVAEFEQAWRCGRRPDLAGLLPDGEERRAVLVELVHADLEFRLKAGEPARVEDYLERFPELAGDAEAVRQLAAAEFGLRRRREPGLDPDEYGRRLPAHAADLLPLLARLAAPASPPSTVASPTHADEVDPPPPAAELRLADYEILGELGRGGMGVVYRAFDRRRRADVALKTLPRLDPSGLYRFKQEFRALAGVSHPNLVTLHELIAEGPTWFFTMEYVDGVDVLRHVRDGSAVDEGRLRGALRQLGEGLGALHAAGQLHRDVKPSNVLATRTGRVVLLDFGLAAELDAAGRHQTLASGVVGTVAYMAPEQAVGLPVSAASDWYSVGVMLYEALAGRLPFEGNVERILHDKRAMDAPPPRPPADANDLDALCMDLLRRDPEARPSGREVLRRLGAGPAPDVAPAPAGTQPVFVGREAHLRALHEAFSATKEGRTVVVWLHGQSGAGKSALVRRFLDRLAEREEALVLAGRCYEQESVPYKALDSLIDSLSRRLGQLPPHEADAVLPRDVAQLVRLFPVLGGVPAVARAPGRAASPPDQHEARRRAVAALRELLGRLADRRPLVLFIDDLQWGDLDSAALLTELLRPPDPPALLLIGCYRREDRDASLFLRSFFSPQSQAAVGVDRRELAIDPLTEAEARELAGRLLGDDDPDRAGAIAAESGGSPFFVHELVQHLRTVGGRPAADSAVKLQEVLWGRITRLPAEARRLLEVVAVAGRTLRQADACRAAGPGAAEPGTLALLRSGRYLRGTGVGEDDEVEIYHDRIRESVVTHLPAAVLADVHGRLARTLEASGRADPEVLAVHSEGAGESERAGRFYALAAAQADQTLAFDHAARLYRRALELRPGEIEAEEERRLRAKLGHALANAGRGAEAAREYLAAADGARTAEALDLQHRAAHQLLGSGHIDEGLPLLRTVLAAVGLALPTTPRRALVGLLFRRAQLWLRGLRFRECDESRASPEEIQRLDVCWSAASNLSITDTICGAYFQTRNLLLALRIGEPFRLVRALALEAGHLSSAGGAGILRAEKVFQTAEKVAQRVAHPYARAIILLLRACAVGLTGRWRLCEEICRQAEVIFRAHCTGVAWELDTVHRFSLWSLAYQGEIGEARRRLPRVLQEARERGNLYGETGLSTFVEPFLLLAADDPLGARRRLQDSMGQWSRQGFHVQHLTSLRDEAQIDLYLGDGEAAWRRVVRHWRQAARSLLFRVQQLRIFMIEIRARTALAAAVAAPTPGPFLLSAERDCRRLDREKAAWPDALALLLRASVAALHKESLRSMTLLRDAALRLDALDMGLHAAAARRRLGELLGGDSGRSLAAQADAWMHAHQIVNPERMTAMLAPGFSSPRSG